ncbi:MAG: hypothetical protein IT563_11430 [Alphaproteobacteria bacterium]|nr:hypothetical protein [Alphaproteobacteria bacterium]
MHKELALPKRWFGGCSIAVNEALLLDRDLINSRRQAEHAALLGLRFEWEHQQAHVRASGFAFAQDALNIISGNFDDSSIYLPFGDGEISIRGRRCPGGYDLTCGWAGSPFCGWACCREEFHFLLFELLVDCRSALSAVDFDLVALLRRFPAYAH